MTMQAYATETNNPCCACIGVKPVSKRDWLSLKRVGTTHLHKLIIAIIQYFSFEGFIQTQNGPMVFLTIAPPKNLSNDVSYMLLKCLFYRVIRYFPKPSLKPKTESKTQNRVST